MNKISTSCRLTFTRPICSYLNSVIISYNYLLNELFHLNLRKLIVLRIKIKWVFHSKFENIRRKWELDVYNLLLTLHFFHKIVNNIVLLRYRAVWFKYCKYILMSENIRESKIFQEMYKRNTVTTIQNHRIQIRYKWFVHSIGKSF